jgi:hypothetical protein
MEMRPGKFRQFDIANLVAIHRTREASIQVVRRILALVCTHVVGRMNEDRQRAPVDLGPDWREQRIGEAAPGDVAEHQVLSQARRTVTGSALPPAAHVLYPRFGRRPSLVHSAMGRSLSESAKLRLICFCLARSHFAETEVAS